MRIVVDTATNAILQVENSVPVGTARPFNGRYALPIPDMVSLDVDATSYVLPVDGGDVMSQAMQGLLIAFPMYTTVEFNPLLTAADMADLDLTAVFTPTGDVSRAMIGRGAGPLPTGASPNSVCVLPQNNSVAPARPGVLISDTITIAGPGSDEFAIWWQVYDLDTTEDVTSSYGGTSGLNDPAIRNLTEQDPEPAGFAVYLSHDNGVTYTAMNYLDPTDFGVFGTQLRIAFVNTGSTRRYVAAYAILY